MLNAHIDKKLKSFDQLSSHQLTPSQHQHNHTLEYLNGIKINSAINFTAGKEVAKGYNPGRRQSEHAGHQVGGKVRFIERCRGSESRSDGRS